MKYKVDILGARKVSMEEYLDGNVDVTVTFTDGTRYIPTFFTLDNIAFLMQKDKKMKEDGEGAFFWSDDMVIVPELSEKAIHEAVHKMVETRYLFNLTKYPPEEK